MSVPPAAAQGRPRSDRALVQGLASLVASGTLLAGTYFGSRYIPQGAAPVVSIVNGLAVNFLIRGAGQVAREVFGASNGWIARFQARPTTGASWSERVAHMLVGGAGGYLIGSYRNFPRIGAFTGALAGQFVATLRGEMSEEQPALPGQQIALRAGAIPNFDGMMIDASIPGQPFIAVVYTNPMTGQTTTVRYPTVELRNQTREALQDAIREYSRQNDGVELPYQAQMNFIFSSLQAVNDLTKVFPRNLGNRPAAQASQDNRPRRQASDGFAFEGIPVGGAGRSGMGFGAAAAGAAPYARAGSGSSPGRGMRDHRQDLLVNWLMNTYRTRGLRLDQARALVQNPDALGPFMERNPPGEEALAEFVEIMQG